MTDKELKKCAKGARTFGAIENIKIKLGAMHQVRISQGCQRRWPNKEEIMRRIDPRMTNKDVKKCAKDARTLDAGENMKIRT